MNIKRIIYIIIIFFTSIISNNVLCQDSLNFTPKRNILIGLETGGNYQVWKDPYNNEKTVNYSIRLAPRLGIGIKDKFIIGGFYEYEFTNKVEIPKIHGYGVFSRFYFTFLDSKINSKFAKKNVRFYPHTEVIFTRSNTFYEENSLIISADKSNKFNSLSLGIGVDLKLFSIPLYINLGYRSLFFLDSPQKKILWIVPKLAFNVTF